MPILLRCHPGIGARVEGEALGAKDNFSARYDLDPRPAFSRGRAMCWPGRAAGGASTPARGRSKS
jgi:hypothetical protein